MPHHIEKYRQSVRKDAQRKRSGIKSAKVHLSSVDKTKEIEGMMKR
jgi:hypothetical protein